MDTIGKTDRKKHKSKSSNPFIPEDLIPNILSRLPAKSAIRCRLVCRKWRDLISDREFVDLHFRISNLTILAASNPHPGTCSPLKLFALDKWWEPAESSFMLHRFPFCVGMFSNTSRALFSQAGLVVFLENHCDFTIINITSCENVRITFPKELWGSKIFGVYFHPSLKEYCSLWMLKYHRDHPEGIQYMMLNLGSNPSLKKLSNPFSNRYIKRRHANPLFINNYLYWMLEEQRHRQYGHNDVMEFDIISEEFTVMPCPVPLDTECWHYQTHLLNIDGLLSFLLISPSKITIWKLEDHAENFWTAVDYTFNKEIYAGFELNLIGFDAIGVVNGKLALLIEGRLVVCNLTEGSVENYKRNYGRNASFLSHKISLASLRNCKPTIFIDQDGQVVEASNG